MGEQQVQLIEKNVANNTEDIREIKREMERVKSDVVELKSTSKLMQQSQSHLMENISELKGNIKALGDKWEEKWERDKEDEAKRFEQDRRDRNKALWQIGTTIIIAMILVQLGLK